jgi:hypothetical protein
LKNRYGVGYNLKIDKKSREFNADEKSEDLLNYIIWYAESYQGNHILIPYGTDFSYSNAE